ncbi:MAG: putative glycosyltransferase [Paracoccaceae bacterium]|jgi:predicted glycosyltransferase
MRVLIVVTHLLGTGHLSRALTLAHAFKEAGHHVRLVSGGMPAPQLDQTGVEMVQLPPLQSDGTNFIRLLDATNQPADDSYLTNRRAALVATLDPAPDVVMTELYPFGRRILAKEFLALLDVAHTLPRRPVILSSIRDILAPPSKPAKATTADQIIAQYYDAVLVHSDPQTTTLDQSWPVSDTLAAKLRYTGYVAPDPTGPHPDRAGTGEILVSAGGGQVGTPIFEAAMAAAQAMPNRQWRLLVGGRDPKARIDALRATYPNSPAHLDPARRDFRAMLYHAAASVSMCGYNTALDLLQAGPPAVLIPFDAGQETEQTLRAHSLTTLSGIKVLANADLTPDTLCAAVASAIAAPRRSNTGLRFDGAAQSVALACNMVKARA